VTVDVLDSLPEDRLEELVALYRDYDWWADRDPDRIRSAVAETDLLVALHDPDVDRLVASARVLTDYTYYGTVYDVVVAADRRGEGLGGRLMDAVRDHPDLDALPSLTLLCREGLVDFYESVGFERADGRVDHPDGDPEPLVRMKVVFET